MLRPPGYISRMSVKDRLDMYKKIDGNHWIWTAALNRCGYGVIKLKRKSYLVHKLAYCEYNNIPIESLKELVLHDPTRCNFPACFNPAHLKTGDQTQNMQDEQLAGHNFNTNKTHCIRGHEFNEENTYYAGNRRQCRACRRLIRHDSKPKKGIRRLSLKPPVKG